MLKISLFGKLAVTLKLSSTPEEKTVEKVAAKKVNLSFPLPTVVQSTGRPLTLDKSKVENLFNQFVNESLKKELVAEYEDAIRQGFIIHLLSDYPNFVNILKSDAANLSAKLRKYKDTNLPNFLFGIGWPVALTAKGENADLEKRINTEIKNMNALLSNDVSAKRIKQFTMEFDPSEKRWVDRKDDIASRVRNTKDDIVSLYIQKNPTKANEILQREAGWGSGDTTELANALAKEALKDINPLSFGESFVKTLMATVKKQLGSAEYFIERDAIEQKPQDIMDELFHEILMDVQKESRRAVGIKKKDAHRWSSPSLPRYDLKNTYSISYNMKRTVQSRVYNRTTEMLNTEKRTTNQPVLKGQESRKQKDIEFAAKELAKAHNKVVDQVFWAKDLNKLLNLLEHLRDSGKDQHTKNRAAKALTAIKVTMTSMRSNVPYEDLAAADDQLTDLENKLESLLDDKTREHTEFNFGKAEKLLKEVGEIGTSSKQRSALINTFKTGENAKAIAQAYALPSSKFNTPFFSIELPRMIQETVVIKPKEKADGSEGRLEPFLKPKKEQAIDEMFSRESSRKAQQEPRVRTGSLWIEKLYRDFLRNK